jgi:RNA polymerase sigma-70 factor (ECF subfamily)
LDGPEKHPALDDETFRSLAIAELTSVYRLAVNLARDRAEADDLVQETYLRAFRAADSFRLEEFGLRPWLFRILNNVFRTRRRDNRRNTELPDQSSVAAPAEVEAVFSTSQIDWDHVDEQLKSAILSLPDELRAVFLLFAVEDLKYREIAAVLQIPIGTVMSRLSRARSALAGALGKSVQNKTRSKRVR